VEFAGAHATSIPTSPVAPVAPAIIHKLTVHRLAIPLRVLVRHAAAERAVSDAVIVSVELANGLRGFGETLARLYVTCETADSVVASIEQAFIPLLLTFHPTSFPDALEFIEALPWKNSKGKQIPAARAAVELALLDVAMRRFQRSVDDIVQWMGLPHFGRPGCIRSARFGGVLAGDDPARMLRQLRLMYWGGLRDFKLKVGTWGDETRVRAVAKYLAGPMARGKASLRVDANGAWNVDQAAEWLSEVGDIQLAGIEQPLPRGQEESLQELRGGSDALIIHDESLITVEDARRLIEMGVADAFNIRISKCGGFVPSLRLAALARKHGVKIQLGCMVGETSILSAAGLRFLEVCPEAQWVEGCFGSFLLRGDVVRKSLRFGYGGRPPKLAAAGWGIEIDDMLLNKWTLAPPTILNL
jgi:muconate cycloisomerase